MSFGVTAAENGLDDISWNVVGQIYTPKLHTENVFLWHGQAPAETFVPPHIHPKQDEWFYVLEGELEIECGADSFKVGLGGTARLPRGIPHAIYNRSGADASAVFGVAPSRKLFDLFAALDGVTEPAELVRLSALHEVGFLPPPSQD